MSLGGGVYARCAPDRLLTLTLDARNENLTNAEVKTDSVAVARQNLCPGMSKAPDYGAR